MRLSPLALVPLALLAACGSNTSPGPSGVHSTSAALLPLATCADVEVAVREAAVRDMEKRVDQNLASALQSAAYCQGSAGSGGTYGGADAGAAPGASGSAGSSSYDPGTDDSNGKNEGANEASGTNNQVVGVDEADFVKNDNKFIYVVANGKLHVVDAWPAAEANMLSSQPIEGTPDSMFVSGARLLVYSSIPQDPNDPYYSGGYYQPCTYGYECDFAGNGQPTLITIFDITDKTSPVKLRELRTSGSLVSSRRIGNAVHTVLTTPGFRFPNVVEHASVDYCDDPIVIWNAYQELKKQNAKLIRSTPIAAQFPQISDTVFTNGQPQTPVNVMADCSGFYASGAADGSAFMTVLSFDMSNESTPSATTVVSRPGAVYASAESLYISVPQTAGYGGYYGMGGGDQTSTVHKFSFASGQPGTTYAGSGEVEGRVLNQFSMDERDGFLRIATTTGYTPDPSVHSTLSILGQGTDELVLVGKVANIAPTEDIRSVRFDGDRGFIVTFKKTDPLFVLDLSNPRTPSIMGELKIPGFSTYMHMMDPTHLLTIGYDADDQGDFAWFAGVRLQIFDVTNMSDPKLLHYHVIGTRGSSSEALTNHLAFNYFKGRLALPMTICEGGSGGSYGTNMTFNGLMVFDVSLDGGFQEKGRVAHPNDSSGTGYNNSVCSNWWTNASTEVKRSIFMDQFVYSLSTTRMKITEMTTPFTDMGELSLK